MTFKIFIINLDRSVERYQSALAQLAKWPGLPIERVSAADGRVMSDAEIAHYYSLRLNQQRYHKLLKAGEKGCFISHIRCWQRIVEQQLDFALILEDDFLVNGDLAALLQDVAKLPAGWQLLKLAMPNKQQKIIATEPAGQFKRVFFAKNPVSTVAQLVSADGARQLLAAAVPFYRPVDVALQHTWELGIRAEAMWPLIFKPDLSFESNINTKSTEVVNRRIFYWQRLRFLLCNVWNNIKLYGVVKAFTASKWPNPTGRTHLSK